MPKDIFFGLKKLSTDLTVYGHFFFIIRLLWSKMGWWGGGGNPILVLYRVGVSGGILPTPTQIFQE